MTSGPREIAGAKGAAYIAAALTLVFWASSFVAIRYALRSFTPGGLAALRFVAAAVALLVVAPMIGRQAWAPVRLRDVALFAVLGLLGFVGYNIGLNVGERTVTAGTSSFIVGQIPIVTAVVNRIAFRERIAPRAVIGIALGLAGTIIIVMTEKGGGAFDAGVFAIMGAVVFESVYFVLQRASFHRFSPFQIDLWTIVCAALCMTPLLADAFVAGPPADAGPWLAVAYLGVFPAALAYFLWSYAIKTLGVVVTASSLYALPFLTLVMGFVFLREWPALPAIGGGILALIGAAIVHAHRDRGR